MFIELFLAELGVSTVALAAFVWLSARRGTWATTARVQSWMRDLAGPIGLYMLSVFATAASLPWSCYMAGRLDEVVPALFTAVLFSQFTISVGLALTRFIVYTVHPSPSN